VADDYDRLGSHIQHTRTKARRSIIGDMRELIKDHTALGFFDGIFAPTADHLHALQQANFTEDPHAPRLNAALRYLGALPGTEWIPPALVHAQEYGTGEGFARFLERLERFTLGLQLRNMSFSKRVDRQQEVIDQLRASAGNVDAVDALTLRPDDHVSIADRIETDLYRTNSQLCKAVLCRLSGLFDAGPSSLPYKDLSVEHVLPLRPGKTSRWLAMYPEKGERDELAAKLGNLVLLPVDGNGSAGNLEFEDKRRQYFPGGTLSPYAVTNDLWNVMEWTPTALRDRHAAVTARMRALLQQP
jgi:Protein of unknown function (DUF1524)